MTESISGGDDRYTLQVEGDAHVANGVLNCDGNGDFVYSEHNLDFSMESHSLEVLAKINDINNRGGGTIAIDSNYNSNDPDAGYGHNQFDAIVYNENEDSIWISGSEFFRRTQIGDETAVEETTSSILNFIHMVIVYDFEANLVTIYRDGQVYGTPYEPGKIYITFCL